MKIIKLLEGSELLYHVTSQDSMLGMLQTGGIQLADLRYSAWERGLMDNSHPSSSGKLYFLSTSLKLMSLVRFMGMKVVLMRWVGIYLVIIVMRIWTLS